MQGNVKHGDYLRTLGGAMTAQCKVLHLLFSQSDYPKIVECHFIERVLVCACVFYRCVITERFWWRLSVTRGEPPPCTCPLLCLQADQRSTSPWNDTVMKSYFVFCFFVFFCFFF